MQSELTIAHLRFGLWFCFRTLAYVGLYLSIAVACVSPSRKIPSELPPPHTKWVRSYSIDEFEKEVFREDAEVSASSAVGVFHVRMFPTPEAWESLKASMPETRIVWRFEPDGSDFRNLTGTHMIGGAGFAALDDRGQIKVFHNAIFYGSGQTI